MRYFCSTKIACHNAHILKIYNRQQFKNALRWYIVKNTPHALCGETNINF